MSTHNDSTKPDPSPQAAQPQARGQARPQGGAQAESVTTQPAPRDPSSQTPQSTQEKHRATPSKQAQKSAFDPSQPLANAKLERMAQLRVEGCNQQEAYRKTRGGQLKRKSAKEQASRLFHRPDVSARVDWLTRHREAPPAAAIPPPPARGKEINLPKGPEANLLLAQRKAREALQLAETPQDIVKAVAACRELGVIQPEGEQPPDPTLVLQAILSYAGRTGEQICEQLGGLAFMLDKFITVCKVTPEQVRETLNSRYPREN